MLTRNSSAPCINYYVLLYLYPARHIVLLLYHTVATLVILVRLDHWKNENNLLHTILDNNQKHEMKKTTSFIDTV